MANLGKRMKSIKEGLSLGEVYTPSLAFTRLKELSSVKFDEAVDISINLGIDAKKGDQAVRGSSNMPHGLGKERRVAVFTQGDKIQQAEEAGADAVGMDDLAERVRGDDFNFDVVIASPDAMATVGKLGQLLGPKGLMPNPKLGTVTDNIAVAVKQAKAGQVHFRADKGGVVHATIGKLSFAPAQLEENLTALVDDVVKVRPSTVKGIYLKKITVSSTMGPALLLDCADLTN